jgi:glucose uptake protein
MKRPLDVSPPPGKKDNFEGHSFFHWLGLPGGVAWCLGTVLSLVAANAYIVGSAVSCAVGQGCTMFSAARGVFVWHKFAEAPAGTRTQLALMFVCFVLGLTAVALAPIVSYHLGWPSSRTQEKTDGREADGLRTYWWRRSPGA